ncbi:MAG: hypothetical protein ABSF50_04790 [Burkholderiaceae bacterium]
MSDIEKPQSDSRLADASALGARKHTSVKRAAHRAHRLVDAAADRAVNTMDTVTDTADRILATPQHLAQSFTDAVVENPWRSLGFALAVGFVLGRLTRP